MLQIKAVGSSPTRNNTLTFKPLHPFTAPARTLPVTTWAMSVYTATACKPSAHRNTDVADFLQRQHYHLLRVDELCIQPFAQPGFAGSVSASPRISC